MASMPKLERAAAEQVCWAVAQRMTTFTYADLSAEAHVSMRRAMDVVTDWCNAGRCEAVGKGVAGTAGHRMSFRVCPAAEGRSGGSVAQNLWTSMRKLKVFTPTDLVAMSSTEEVPVTIDTAQSFCQALMPGGYLRVRQKATPGKREARYQLIRDTGPRPPRPRRVRAIWDDNLGEFVHVAGGAK